MNMSKQRQAKMQSLLTDYEGRLRREQEGREEGERTWKRKGRA